MHEGNRRRSLSDRGCDALHAAGAHIANSKNSREAGFQRVTLITEIVEGGPASKGGVRDGDIIIALDGSAIGGVDDLQRLLTADSIGRATEVALLRGPEASRDDYAIGGAASVALGCSTPPLLSATICRHH